MESVGVWRCERGVPRLAAACVCRVACVVFTCRVVSAASPEASATQEPSANPEPTTSAKPATPTPSAEAEPPPPMPTAKSTTSQTRREKRAARLRRDLNKALKSSFTLGRSSTAERGVFVKGAEREITKKPSREVTITKATAAA